MLEKMNEYIEDLQFEIGFNNTKNEDETCEYKFLERQATNKELGQTIVELKLRFKELWKN
tara:strand:+ start:442 stop:621 length:180 start_codon:yes stop_codon:yes gene_type:complete